MRLEESTELVDGKNQHSDEGNSEARYCEEGKRSKPGITAAENSGKIEGDETEEACNEPKADVCPRKPS